jgi:hypothetical protein
MGGRRFGLDLEFILTSGFWIPAKPQGFASASVFF